jgi:hypothetical protein
MAEERSNEAVESVEAFNQLLVCQFFQFVADDMLFGQEAGHDLEIVLGTFISNSLDYRLPVFLKVLLKRLNKLFT